MNNFTAGAISSIFSLTLVAPLDFIKVRQQAGFRYKSVGSSLWKGHSVTMITLVPSKTLFMGLYTLAEDKGYNTFLSSLFANGITTILVNPLFFARTMMRVYEINFMNAVGRLNLQNMFCGTSASLIGSTIKNWIYFTLYNKLKKKYHKNSWDIMYISAMAKVVSSTLTYPYETIRTRMRVGGTGSYYSGLTLHILRTIPHTMIMFTIFEYLRQIES